MVHAVRSGLGIRNRNDISKVFKQLKIIVSEVLVIMASKFLKGSFQELI